MSKKKSILIRTNGNNKVGMGHIYRSITIAKELKKKNFDIHFLIPNNKILGKRIEKFGICHFASNKEKEIKLIAKISPDIILVDLLKKYFPHKENFWREISNKCKVLVTIDFNGKELKYVDLSFNPLFNSSYYAKQNFNGIKYCPIRKEFKKVRKKYKVNERVKSILILQGGADTKCFIPKILNSLRKISKDIKINVITGSAFKCKKELEICIKKMNRDVIVLNDIKNISNELVKHDIIITGAGVTLIEILTIGIPAIIITGDKHELENSRRITRKNSAVSLGYGKDITQKNILKEVENLIKNYKKRKLLSRNGKKISDGKGLDRIIEIIYKKIT